MKKAKDEPDSKVILVRVKYQKSKPQKRVNVIVLIEKWKPQALNCTVLAADGKK